MTRTLLAIAALAVAAAAPASAYTPNPYEPYVPKKGPCLKCGFAVKPGTIYINPGVKYRIFESKLSKVALNPQPLPPEPPPHSIGKVLR